MAKVRPQTFFLKCSKVEQQAADSLQTHVVKFNICNKTPLRDRLLSEYSPSWKHESVHKQMAWLYQSDTLNVALPSVSIGQYRALTPCDSVQGICLSLNFNLHCRHQKC